MALTLELTTLETLYNTLKTHVTSAHEIQTSIDRDLSAAVWETPNAETFRATWEDFKPKLQAFEAALAAAATDVANNHNNNAIANQVTEAPVLAAVNPI